MNVINDPIINDLIISAIIKDKAFGTQPFSSKLKQIKMTSSYHQRWRYDHVL